MGEPVFLDVEDVLHIHRREIGTAGGDPGMRDRAGLEAAVAAPRATLDGAYLLDLFQMAAAYLVAIAVRHPFIDGNKRTAAAAALTFLYMNGYEITEQYPEELADVVLAMLLGRMDREALGLWFRTRSEGRSHGPPLSFK